jgi:hypothetical protein
MALDSIESDARRYSPRNAAFLVGASGRAYEDQSALEGAARNEWGADEFHFFDHEDTQAFLVADQRAVIVAFRGTEPHQYRDWITDAQIERVPGPFGDVHEGFLAAYRAVHDAVTGVIAETRTQGQSLWFTGHSLGAALATLAAAHADPETVSGVYTYGQPRTGNGSFARSYNRLLGDRTFRFVNNNDIVPRVPLAWRYRHVGIEIYFDADGRARRSLPWWKLLLDRVRGRIADLGVVGTAGMKDHRIVDYARLVERNRDFRP